MLIDYYKVFKKMPIEFCKHLGKLAPLALPSEASTLSLRIIMEMMLQEAEQPTWWIF